MTTYATSTEQPDQGPRMVRATHRTCNRLHLSPLSTEGLLDEFREAGWRVSDSYPGMRRDADYSHEGTARFFAENPVYHAAIQRIGLARRAIAQRMEGYEFA